VYPDDDVTIILDALLEIRTNVRRVLALLAEDNGQERDEEEDS
jgi:hypothetical protein